MKDFRVMNQVSEKGTAGGKGCAQGRRRRVQARREEDGTVADGKDSAWLAGSPPLPFCSSIWIKSSLLSCGRQFGFVCLLHPRKTARHAPQGWSSYPTPSGNFGRWPEAKSLARGKVLQCSEGGSVATSFATIPTKCRLQHGPGLPGWKRH